MTLFNKKEIEELFARVVRLENSYRNHDSNFLAYNSKMNTIYRNIQNNLKDIEQKMDGISKENQLIRQIMNDDIDIQKTNTERLKNMVLVTKKNEDEIKRAKENINSILENLKDPGLNSITIKHDKTLERLIDEFKEFKKKALIIDDRKHILT